MATPARERVDLEARVSEQRSEEQQKGDRRVWWWLALTSLWAPPTVFACALAPYIVLVELSTPAHRWAQPLLKAFGLLMVAWFIALLVARLALPRFRKLRSLRHESKELADELAKLTRRHGEKIDASTREALFTQAAAVDRARISGEIAPLEAEYRRLAELSDKGLATWRKHTNIDFVAGFAKALFIALLIRAVIIEPFRIPSGSMIPTLQVGDQIFVNKFIYGVRIPWMNKVPFQIVRAPERGDVIVFNNPVNTSVDYIKRVIGVPGDVIEVRDEVVYVNGQPQQREKLTGDYQAWDDQGGDWAPVRSIEYREHLDGHVHETLQSGRDSDLIEGPYIVPPASVFVMGDNRDNSEDSRYGLSLYSRGNAPQAVYVPYGNIKGKAMIIWLSLSHGGFLSSLFGGTGLRTDRLFLPVR
jgi:signal peptidase I